MNKCQWNLLMDYFLVSGWTFCHSWCNFADITTIIIIETEIRTIETEILIIMAGKTPITPATGITRETGTGIINHRPMTGEGTKNPEFRAFSKKTVESPRKSSEAEDDVLKSLSTRTYNRYDDRNYGREDPYYSNSANRDTGYNDQRYNTNSYRGNGKDHKNDRSRVLIWSITLCWSI